MLYLQGKNKIKTVFLDENKGELGSVTTYCLKRDNDLIRIMLHCYLRRLEGGTMAPLWNEVTSTTEICCEEIFVENLRTLMKYIYGNINALILGPGSI